MEGLSIAFKCSATAVRDGGSGAPVRANPDVRKAMPKEEDNYVVSNASVTANGKHNVRQRLTKAAC